MRSRPCYEPRWPARRSTPSMYAKHDNDAERRSRKNIARIVVTEIDARQADHHRRPGDREGSESPRLKPNCGRQRKKQRGVIARERAPCGQRVWVDPGRHDKTRPGL